jgi:hypothetical protein
VFPGHIETLQEMLFATLDRDGTRELEHLLAPVVDHMRALPPRSASRSAARRRGTKK